MNFLTIFKFIMVVYVPLWFKIKLSPRVEEGPNHMVYFLKLLRNMDERFQNIVYCQPCSEIHFSRKSSSGNDLSFKWKYSWACMETNIKSHGSKEPRSANIWNSGYKLWSNEYHWCHQLAENFLDRTSIDSASVWWWNIPEHIYDVIVFYRISWPAPTTRKLWRDLLSLWLKLQCQFAVETNEMVGSDLQ